MLYLLIRGGCPVLLLYSVDMLCILGKITVPPLQLSALCLSGHVNMHLLFVMSFFIQVVASQDWPDVTNYAALAAVQANGQEWIHDLFGVSPFSGTVARAGGRIMYDLI